MDGLTREEKALGLEGDRGCTTEEKDVDAAEAVDESDVEGLAKKMGNGLTSF